MEDDSLFPAKERIWNSWSLMFRETDVVDRRTRGEMQALPLWDGRGSAIVDIGKTVFIFKRPVLTSY